MEFFIASRKKWLRFILPMLFFQFFFIAQGAAQTGPQKIEFRLTQTCEADSLRAPIRMKEMGQDKYQHLVLSSFLFSGQMFIASESLSWSDEKAIATAATSTALIGIGKEVYDLLSKNGVPSFRDLIADAAGIAIGMFIFTLK